MPKGKIRVVCGPMFAGKTEELIRRIKRTLIAGKKALVIIPAVDKRTINQKAIKSHGGIELFGCPTIVLTEGIFNNTVFEEYHLVFDEFQFYPKEYIFEIEKLATQGHLIDIGGLDTNYLGLPYESMGYALTIASEITKLTAICKNCGSDATKTHRLTNDTELVVPGGAEMYEAQCWECFNN